MATSPRLSDGDESLFDSAQPFRGVVVCCTSVPTELRADIAAKTAELGGLHKYDLTPDCTHLIVGDYDTPKYRHVAKERPDVKPMAAGWVEAVRDLWVEDAEIDFVALESEWQLRTFETGDAEPTPGDAESQRRRLLCCLTGFEDTDERQQLIDKIKANGGSYTGDLTKRVTHLVVYKPEGRKYQAAKNWGVHTVSVEWVSDSVERGAILDEKLYDPVLPKDERGVGAWNKQKAQRVSSLGKRLREKSAAQDEGRRKLRKTASMKLNSQRDNLWGDILGKPQASERPTGAASKPAVQPTQLLGGKSLETQGSKLSSLGVPDDSAVFASCCFYVQGFSTQKTDILVNTIASLGGLICHSLDEVVSTSGAQLAHRFLIVPQTSAPETCPRLPDNVHIITEFYIERCLHKKYFFDPSQHVIGRPFPLFPIPGFEGLSICTAGFTGVDLNQVDKSIRQLGAKYEERFTANISLLLCSSLSVVRKQKLELALAWKVPVVKADWLWECITSGSAVPIKRFLFPELKQDIESPKMATQGKAKENKETERMKRKKAQPSATAVIDKDLRPGTQRSRGADESTSVPTGEQKETESGDAWATARASQTQHRRGPGAPAPEHDSHVTTTTHFETAATHLLPTDDGTVSFGNMNTQSRGAAPLSETSPNSLNKTPTSPRKIVAPRPQRKPISRVASEVADSEATDDDDVGQPSDIPLHEGGDEENDPGREEQLEPRGDPAEQAGQDSRKEEEEEDAEAARKRLEAEKAAERLAISTKLVSSLLDSTAAKLGGAFSAAAAATTTTPAAAASATTGTVTAAGAGAGVAEAGGDDDGSAADRSGPKRRKRNILGRAISNVSAASSTSTSASAGESSSSHHATAAAAAGTTGTTTAPTTTTTTKKQHDAAATAPAAAAAAPPPPPAATQLEYEDPEAKRYTAELMSRMLGTVAAAGKNKTKGRAGGAGTSSLSVGGGGGSGGGERLTLAGMGGYDVSRLLQQQQQQQGYDGYAAALAGVGRRTRRG